MASAERLPEYLEPMLATLGEPFDSDEHLFEIKWDGMRTLAFVDRDGLRMFNRNRVPLVPKYPELEFLARLPAGAVIDGEIVVTVDGRPDFHQVMTRQHATAPMRIAALARGIPATYIVFDLLYRSFEDITKAPLTERREQLAALVEACPDEKLVLSEGIVGGGRAMFEQVRRQELEGVVAKRLGSTYAPGKRSRDWIKIKRKSTVHCAIIGFLPEGKDDFKSLVVAIEEDGVLRSVGQVGSGIDRATRKKLNALLWARLRETPVVASDAPGLWVEPDLFCTVTYLERTPAGNLRAPVFERLLV